MHYKIQLYIFLFLHFSPFEELWFPLNLHTFPSLSLSLFSFIHTHKNRQQRSMSNSKVPERLTLESVRKSLITQEDTIIFSLIERAKHPLNSRLYNPSWNVIPGFSGTVFEYFVKETETIQSKVGRYESPEEHPFFPENISKPVFPPCYHPSVLHPAAKSININKDIWDVYINKLLPQFSAEGDDGNYATTATCDLQCLQALSRRIHYGMFVAEVKFIDAPQDYSPAIHAQDRDALMKLLTFESVEEMVKKRVEKKTMLFAQDVSIHNDSNKEKTKIDPCAVSKLYADWIMPLTKHVQVEYLLRRLY
ncbi:hypothetical protein Leryth_003569 [Lithospermum erythrorhizon]|nr:hypothetical protein Leryth_003569 [Lithospermum erythrorhizon]